jgi:hypothetical protein
MLPVRDLLVTSASIHRCSGSLGSWKQPQRARHISPRSRCHRTKDTLPCPLRCSGHAETAIVRGRAPKSDQMDFVTSAGPPRETRLTISRTGGLLASAGAPNALFPLPLTTGSSNSFRIESEAPQRHVATPRHLRLSKAAFAPCHVDRYWPGCSIERKHPSPRFIQLVPPITGT